MSSFSGLRAGARRLAQLSSSIVAPVQSTGGQAIPWVIVDVETSGLNPRTDRVLSVAALALDHRGRVSATFSSLLDPGCDPGPVHIHRLTRQKLAGSPRFEDIAPHLMAFLDGRIMVAHNAKFDYGFLRVESMRAGVTMPTSHRLCTLTLARRVQPGLPNYRLSTLASHWKVPQRRAHDAGDDARVLVDVFTRTASLARSLDMPLPVVPCTEKFTLHQPTIPRIPCEWINPGPYLRSAPLVQGMKVAISGGTRVPRLELARMLSDAGLEVMNSVSRYTSLLLCTNPFEGGTKVARARQHGLEILSEAEVIGLLRSVQPGAPRSPKSVPAKQNAVKRTAAKPAATPSSVTVPPPPALPQRPSPEQPATTDSWSGRRVLVVGGSHADAVVMRSRLIQLGATPAVNLSATVSDVLILADGEGDPRIPRIIERGLRSLSPADVDRALQLGAPRESVERTPSASTVLPRGGVVDVDPDVCVLTVDASWGAVDSADLDIVAFLLTADHVVSCDEDFVFFNQPETPDNAVTLSRDGDREQGVRLDLALVGDEVDRVVVAAVVDEPITFGDVGPLSVSISGPDFAVATAVLDAATTERSLLLVEIYRRAGRWRVRAIGQGYDEGLGHLAVRYGVEVDD